MKIRRYSVIFGIFSVAMAFVGCGEDSTNASADKNNADVVATVSDLPSCKA